MSELTESHDPTRARLIDAAKRVFASKGYQATRVSDVVEAAGVAQGTFYLYFASKEEAFRQLVDEFHATVLEPALRVTPSAEQSDPGEAIDAIRNVWLTALYGFRDDRPLARIILREARGMNPDVSDTIQAYYARTVDALVECVRTSSLKHMVRDVDLELVGWAVVGMFERVAYQKIVLEGRDDVEYIADQLFKLELHGLLCRHVRQ